MRGEEIKREREEKEEEEEQKKGELFGCGKRIKKVVGGHIHSNAAKLE